MNNQIKKQWCDELRSDKHVQGQYQLHNSDGSKCCLGVLCEMYTREHGARWVPNKEDDPDFFSLFGRHAVLPLEVQIWAELEDDLGSFEDDEGNYRTISEYNDGDEEGMIRQFSFAEIADIIEAKL